MVNSITEIDICISTGEVHSFGSFGPPASIGMRSFICCPAIGFGFNNDATSKIIIDICTKDFPQEFLANGKNIFPLIEVQGEFGHGLILRKQL
jgi:hypothetical protein